MTEQTPAVPAPKPTRKKPGPKKQSHLDAVTLVGAEFEALNDVIEDEQSRTVALQIVRCPLGHDFSRLALACAGLTPEQRTLATALCQALTK